MIVWSIIWMIAILLVAVSILIYYIIRYDHFVPNDFAHSHDSHASHGGSDSGE